MAKIVRLFIVVVFAVACLVAVGCGGARNPNGPDPVPPPANGGGTEATHFTIKNLVYHRIMNLNPNLDPKFGPNHWGLGDEAVCRDSRWDAEAQNFTCDALQVKVGVVNKLTVPDLARFIGAPTSEWVCSDVSVNGQMLKPTAERPSEYCYFKVDAVGNITSTDANGNPK